MSLYRDDILDHYRYPQNFGKPSTFTHAFEQSNQLCGDRQSVYMIINDGVIQDARFEGSGCAISIAASSLLSEMIKGKSIQALLSLGEQDIRTMFGSEIAPGRMDCALLGLRSFQKAIETTRADAPEERSFPNTVGEQGVAMRAQYVNKESNLGEIAAKYPQAARVFMEYGLHCVGCFASAFDTVEAGAMLHGMSALEIEDMVKRANEEIERHPEETTEIINHESGMRNRAEIPPSYSSPV